MVPDLTHVCVCLYGFNEKSLSLVLSGSKMFEHMCYVWMWSPSTCFHSEKKPGVSDLMGVNSSHGPLQGVHESSG